MLSFSVSYLPQHTSTISSFLWSPTQWCFTFLSFPAFWLGHLFFAHVPSSNLFHWHPDLPPTTVAISALHICLHPRPLFWLCCCQFKLEWIKWNYISAIPYFVHVQCHFLTSFSVTPYSLSQRFQVSPKPAVFSPCPSLRNNLFFLNRTLFNFSILTATATTSTYSFPKYSAPPQHRQLFPE